MRYQFIYSFAALVLCAGLATAQSPKTVKQNGVMPPVSSQPQAAVVEHVDSMPTSGDTIAEIVPASHDGIAGSSFSPFSSCGSCGSCDSCAVCGPEGVFWVNLEYLTWWTKGVKAPPLVTTSALASSGGIIGNPGTGILYGGNDIIHQGPTSGGRFNVGLWLNDAHTCGLEGNYFFLGEHAKNANFSGDGSPGSPVLARPFFNVNSGQEDSELVSFPGLLAGTVHVRTSNRLTGGEVNGLWNVCCGGFYRIDVLGGLRYFQMNEGLTIDEDLAILPGVNVVANNRFTIVDQFDTTNKFWGGNIGIKGEVRYNKFYSEFTGKVAIGGVQEVVTINGATAIIPGVGTPFVALGGLLAQQSNIGRFTHRTFAVLPEAGLDLGYQVCENTRVYVGYTFLYLSKAARSGDQIDRGLNPTQIPINTPITGVAGPARPQFTFRDSDFWAQGARVGLEFRY